MNGLLLNGENVCISGANTPLMELDALAVKWITYVIAVEQLNGAPTAAALTPAFQGLPLGGQGNYIDQYQTSSNLPWFDLTDGSGAAGSAGALADLVPGGAWGTIATQTFVNTSPVTPVVFVRRIRGGFPHRLMLRSTFTGGTTPSWRASVWINQEF